MRFPILILMILAAACLGACSSTEEAADTSTGEAGGAAAEATNDHGHAHASVDGTVEVGCAMCTYGVDGVTTCTPAAMVDGQPKIITGQPVDAHALGLCQSAKQAHIKGEVHGDNLVVSVIEIE